MWNDHRMYSSSIPVPIGSQIGGLVEPMNQSCLLHADQRQKNQRRSAQAKKSRILYSRRRVYSPIV